MWKRGLTKGFLNSTLSILDLTFSDHGILRIFWSSMFKLPGNAYRSNQPYPWQIEKYKKRYGIKTIINLRGKRNCSSYYLEKEFCDNNNITLHNFPITSRDLPSRKTIQDFFKLLDNVTYPLMMHCKSGADRAGIASCLFLIYKQGYDVNTAIKQLSFKYLHVKFAKTGILDHLFETAILNKKVSSKDFLKWINSDYNKEEIKKSFKPYKLADFFLEKIIKRE